MCRMMRRRNQQRTRAGGRQSGRSGALPCLTICGSGVCLGRMKQPRNTYAAWSNRTGSGSKALYHNSTCIARKIGYFTNKCFVRLTIQEADNGSMKQLALTGLLALAISTAAVAQDNKPRVLIPGGFDNFAQLNLRACATAAYTDAITSSDVRRKQHHEADKKADSDTPLETYHRRAF